MTQLTGRAEFFIDSVKMGTVAGGTIKHGGEVREIVQGQFKPLGYKVTGVAPGGVELEIADQAGLKVSSFDITDGTVMVSVDTGGIYVITEATRTGDPPELNVDSGTWSVTIEGQVALFF